MTYEEAKSEISYQGSMLTDGPYKSKVIAGINVLNDSSLSDSQKWTDGILVLTDVSDNCPDLVDPNTYIDALNVAAYTIDPSKPSPWRPHK